MGVVAALAAEARALGPSMPRAGIPPLSELAWVGDGALLAVSGIGLEAAQSAARALLDAGASALMTFGMAGGLDPTLKAGTVVLPRELISEAGTHWLASSPWRERVAAEVSPLRAVSEGNLLTVARAIDSPADKAAAFLETGAVAADMESAAVAEIAGRHQLPFIAVRVIVDTAADQLPRAVVNASRAGKVHIGRLAAGLAAAPGDIAALFRLAQRYRIALHSLKAIGSHLS